MFLDHIALGFYRGIGPEIQCIGPFSRLNLFIGPNNSGKSAVLNFLAGHLKKKLQGENTHLIHEENYFGDEKGSIFLALGSNTEIVSKDFSEKIKENYSVAGQSFDIIKKNVDDFLSEISLNGVIFFSYSSGKISLFPEFDNKNSLSPAFRRINHYLGRPSRVDQPRYQIEMVLSALRASVQKETADIYLIPAKRQLGEKGSSFEGLNGDGLIEHLAMLQNPAYYRQEDRVKFKKINSFLKSVTGKSDAELEVPSGREHLVVHMDNKVLPLSSLGTGVHEVILIAAFCAIYDGSIICIEEPEIHRHPILQKKLINYIIENTESQYFIATHSSSFIDTRNASVFSVYNDGVQTHIKSAMTKIEKRNILNDMGYLASDLLQANAVIWVEGPSDRIYINHWITAYNSDLVEGIHYTMMFYGGSLIRHLTASDEATEEFIKLQDLNRRMIVVFDSDRGAEGGPLKSHVERISKQIDANGGVAWITEGREIENYIETNLMQEALKNVHPKIFFKPKQSKKFDNSFHFYRADPKHKGRGKLYKEADKVGVAEFICSKSANLEIFDLHDKIAEICDFIVQANKVD